MMGEMERFRGKQAWLIYDGDCPLCSAYVVRLKLLKIFSKFELVNARERVAIVHEVIEEGYDLDEGMVLKIGNEIFHGDACVNILASITDRQDVFNSVNSFIFSRASISRKIYPLFRVVRNFVLIILFRKKIRKKIY